MNVKTQIATAASTMIGARRLLREAGQMKLADKLHALITEAEVALGQVGDAGDP